MALAAVTAAVGAVELSTATPPVFLFRLSNYWFLVLVGGLAALALSVRETDLPSVPTPPEDFDAVEEG